MALFDIFQPRQCLTVLFDQLVPGELLNCGMLSFRLSAQPDDPAVISLPSLFIGFEHGDRLVPTMSAERLMQHLMPSYGHGQVGFHINGEFLCAEPIRFSNRLMNMAFDPLAFNCQVRPFPKKGGKLAIFTQAFNEGDMLLYWERYYAEQVGHENLYVLNNGSTDDSCRRLNPATNVIDMPKVEVDHIEFAQSHGHFQRFLLMRYQWVLKVDTDELLAVDGGLLQALEGLAPGTYTPEIALEPVHDRSDEAAFHFDGDLCAQRRHFVVGTEGLIRPLLSSVPTSWAPGNHVCMEPSAVLPGSAIVHLKYFDFDFLHNKNAKWAKMQGTAREATMCKQIATLNALDEGQIDQFSNTEMAERLAMPRTQIPAWLPAALSMNQ